MRHFYLAQIDHLLFVEMITLRNQKAMFIWIQSFLG